MNTTNTVPDAAAAATITMTRAELERAIADATAQALKAARKRPPPAKIGHTVQEATTASGLGRTSIYEAIKQGQLRAVKRGSRTVILNLAQWLESLPPSPSAG
jgi:hypothetical protein